MSFDKHSNFNKQANFTEVKFGENKPVLEVELNELQQIQNEARADIIRDTIPSGFTQLGEIDYDYCLNNENKIKLKTDSVAYVNGYRINIPKDTIIDIGEAPKKDVREDLLFLEVWREEVNSESKLTIAGGEGQPTISNTIKDKRYPIETTHRVALKWRIRHVANVDFSLHGMDGLERLEAKHKQGHIHAQGGLTQPPFTENQCAWTTEFTKQSDDIGLYKTSNHVNVAPNNDNYLNTVDNQSYAIPMFRLYRKPSCGKSVPFEYSKINPKVNYSKFAKLMKEEKVERVITENIKGRSLVNLLNPTKLRELGWGVGLTYTFDSANCILTNPGNNDFSPWDSATNVMNIIPSSRVFTLILENIKDTSVTTEVRLYNASRESKGVSTANIAPHSTKKLKIQTDADTVGMSFKLYSGTAPSSCKVMALEGDWINKDIPEFFVGLKSLGEDDGNLVTVKNGILNDNTYDINDGNQKLTTFPQVTHVYSKNTVTPQVIANIKRGDVIINPLDELGTKLTTEGIEEIEFSSIKGRTIQNCYPTIATDSFNSLHGTISNGYVTLQGNADYQNAFIPVTKCLIKPNTNYTMILDVKENTLTKDFILTSTNPTDVFKRSVAKVPKGKTGTQRFLVISAEQLDSTMYGLRAFLSGNEAGKVKFKIMLLEGNHTNTPIDELPFVDGVKSVGETEYNKVILETRGKNLHSIEFKNKYRGYTNGFVDDNSNVDGYIAPVKPNTKYFITQQTTDSNYISNICYLDINGNFMYGQPYNNEQLGITTPPNCFYVSYAVSKQAKGVQMEEGEVASPYESPKIYKQEVYLKEPLRSLPNGVCDEIEGNKVIRKVGKIVLDANSTGFSWSNGRFDPNSDQYYRIWGKFTLGKLLPKQLGTASLVSDTFVLIGNDSALQSYLGEGMGHTFNRLENDRQIQFKILTSKLEEVSVSGFVKWLSQNPITVYYELATPIEEYLENVYEKESIKTYQLDAPLRSLPNGVKDEIKDEVLIRRCGEITLDNKTNYRWGIDYTPSPYVYIWDLAGIAKMNSVLFSSKLPNAEDGSISNSLRMSGGVLCFNFVNKIATYNECVAEARRLIGDDGLKIVYELPTPIKIPLTEVKPQTANFSLQRQFAEGNWLRELPNGVRDTIENGKVKRRIEKIVLDGSETWITSSNTSNDYSTFYTTTKTINSEYAICSNNFSYDFITSVSEMKSAEGIYALRDSYNVEVRILTNKLTQNTKEGFKTWLSQNPITVLYELKTVKEETLTTENCNYYPCHDLNTYCGSMYVGEGRNYILSDNKMPSETPVIVETDFRDIDGKAKVEDCGYKKCDDGVNVAFVDSKSKNLIDPMKFAKHVLKCDSSATLIGNELTFSIPAFTQWSNVFPIHGYYKNTQLTCSVMAKRVSGNSGWYFGFVYDDNSYTFDSKTTNMNEYMLFKTTSNPVKNLKGLGMSYDMEGRYTLDLNTLQIELGSTATSHEPFKPKPKYLGTTGENDIEDLRHQVSLTGFNYDKILNESFDKLLRGEL